MGCAETANTDWLFKSCETMHKQRISARRRRIRKLRRSLTSAVEAIHRPPNTLKKGQEPSDGLVGLFEAMTIVPSQRVNRLRQELAEAEAEKHRWQQHAIFERYANGAPGQERSFYARFSIKYAPKVPLAFHNTARSPTPGPKGPAKDRNRLATSRTTKPTKPSGTRSLV